MSELIKYYSKVLDDLNKKYTESTKNYVEEFVKFKIPLFKCSLTERNLNSLNCINQHAPSASFTKITEKIQSINTEYLSLTRELKALFIEQSVFVNNFQTKIDELNEENKKLEQESLNIKDVSATSEPFFHNERLLYYRSLIYLISIVVGIIFVLYMLQSTPFLEVASSVATNTKNMAENAVKGAKGMVENSDETESNNMLRNIIIFLLISAVIISVFYLIIYILRKVNPPLKETETEKKIKEIADTCLRDKSESWVNTQIEKIKTFLTNK
jgi:predicted secreted protein